GRAAPAPPFFPPPDRKAVQRSALIAAPPARAGPVARPLLASIAEPQSRSHPAIRWPLQIPAMQQWESDEAETATVHEPLRAPDRSAEESAGQIVRPDRFGEAQAARRWCESPRRQEARSFDFPAARLGAEAARGLGAIDRGRCRRSACRTRPMPRLRRQSARWPRMR